MLVKYLGAEYDQDSKQWIPRSQFLENGLFRMTQPNFLNDVLSEARFLTYFNEFSPADIDYARRKHRAFSTLSESEEISDKQLIDIYLKPPGIPYTPEFFPTLLGFTDHPTVEAYKEYEKNRLENIAEKFIDFIFEYISCNLGVFSMSMEADNNLMWTHYASEHRGLAIHFDESHDFFQKFKPRSVSYKLKDRATLTVYGDTFRINGEPADSFILDNSINPIKIPSYLENNYGLMDRLLYSKSEDWSYEREKRIICPLSECEDSKGKVINPKINIDIPKNLQNNFNSYKEIYLKNIPFDAIKAITFGMKTDEQQRIAIIEKAKSNPALNHLVFNQVKRKFSQLIIEQIDV